MMMMMLTMALCGQLQYCPIIRPILAHAYDFCHQYSSVYNTNDAQG